jgi:tRNA 2-selenouridine synthase
MSQTKALSIDEALNQKGSYIWVDVRSESEFARAHIPGAINIPILNDADRAEVGTTYKQKGRELAVQVGLRLAGPKFEAFYIALMALQKSHNKPVLFYCWRGGLRSQIASTITQWSGIPVYIVRGGYRSFRHWTLTTIEAPKNIILVAGHTGSGKTEILHLLQRKDQQIIDLEGLANHKGSALGGVGMPEQPRNEMFENLLAIEMFELNPDRFTYIENESRMIGLCAIPQGLWVQMQQAPSIEILVDRETRINRILAEYAHLPKELLIEQTQKLRKRLGGQHEKAAVEALEQNDFRTWVELLLVYYDKSYAHFVEKNNLSLEKFAWDWNQLETSLLSFIELKTS